MERIIGSTGVTDIKGGFRVKMGVVSAQRNEEQLKDLMFLCANALNVIVVEDEDMQLMIRSIDENNTLNLTMKNGEKHSVPFRRTSNENINTKQYAGSNLSTDDLMQLNKTLKHS